MIAWAPGHFGPHAFKPKLFQIQFIDEHVDNPHWVIPAQCNRRGVPEIACFDYDLRRR